jgi:hypothetical protein
MAVWAKDIDLVQCAEVRDVMSADVVAELFEVVSVAFVDDSLSLV